MSEQREETTRDNLTIPVSICKVCDKDRDPLDVPNVSCGCPPENRQTAYVPVVPASRIEQLEGELETAWEVADSFKDDATRAEHSLSEIREWAETPTRDDAEWASKAEVLRLLPKETRG